MTPDQFRQARRQLNLTSRQMAELLGFGSGTAIRQFETHGTSQRIPGARVVRLVQAYLDGYRPADWPLKPGSRKSRS